jgi:hypothetical protein
MPTEELTYRKNVENKLDEILHQVRATNGRVSKLENWRWFISGGITILTALVLPILLGLISRLI